MNTKRHIMLDLETMGSGSNAAIVAIGAVAFDTGIRSKFYAKVHLASSIESGGRVDAGTVLWWLQQSDAARKELHTADKTDTVQKACLNFTAWYADCNGGAVWGNGATFDNVILRNTFDRLCFPAPWSFRDDRCFRTVKALHPKVDVPVSGTTHNALHDATWQAQYLIKLGVL